MIPILLMLGAAAEPYNWAEFKRAVALSGVEEQVAIATEQPSRSNFNYRLTYTRKTLQSTQTYTTTSLTCPALRDVVVSMRDITMPRPAPYGTEDDNRRVIVLDGAYYELRAPSSFAAGEVTISSNVGSPLAAWVDKALTTVRSCQELGEKQR